MKMKRLKEIWKDIPGYEGCYQVSNLGRVRSVDREVVCDKGKRLCRGRILKPGSNHGYLHVELHRLGKRKIFLVARLVLEVFVGSCPDGMEACHNDGVKANNAIWNLRWDTKIANQADRKRHGTSPEGEGNAYAKLTEGDVINIRLRYKTENISQVELSRLFGVHYSTINHIIHRKIWIHI